jgi:GPH family glycoside/pentoside/hexuronide:cation symporter
MEPTHAVHATRPMTEQLPVWRKVLYAIGDFANSVGPGTIVPFWYLFFLTDVARLNPAIAGLTVLIGGIWDAFNDPLVGLISDRTRSRWGRRRPYLLFGAIPFGITFALLWIVPPIENQVLLALYFALIYVLFDTAFTFVGCPYVALTPEMTLDHDERTVLTTYRMSVSIIAGLVAAVGFAVVLDAFPGDKAAAFRTMGIICGVVFVPSTWAGFFGARERDEFQRAPAPSPIEGLRFVMRNREWRFTLAMNLLSWIPVDIASAVFAYYLIYWVRVGATEASLVQGIILASAALCLPLVVWTAKRWEKRTSFMVAMASWAIIMIGLVLVPRGARLLAYLAAVLVGPGVSAAHVLPTAMHADVLDVDELASGRRQEGVYAGFGVFVRKLATKLVLAGIGPLLAWSGYVENSVEQPARALTAIRIAISAVPAVILIAAVAVAWFYPLSRERHREIQMELARRRAASAAIQD